MHLMLLLAFCCVQLLYSSSQAQVINAYAQITGITGTTLNVANVNQTAHNFVVGEYAIVMQMQDDVLGDNTNAITFGDLGSIASAGLYEIREITAVNGNSTLGFSSGAPTTITVSSLINTYNTGSNSRVQLISFRLLSPTDYTTTGNIAALSWNGNIGGVVAFMVGGTLTLNHSISANAAGFVGGARSNNSSGTQCVAANVSLYRANDANTGFKGESIYRNTTNTYNNQRGKILNGGGGGVHHNSGGGGGGNYTAGGNGGNGYNGSAAGCTANPAPGIGGISLASHISSSRVFMGGGGGGGQQNNSASTPGGNGGGIVLIKAGTITTGCGGSVSITANGSSASNTTGSQNDGGGGGGGGGSIVFWVDNWNVLGSCPLTISGNGGNGGSSLVGTYHSGGGGGGQGVVIYNGAQPTTNITTTTNNGTGGCNNNSNPCTNAASPGAGVNGAGVLNGANTNNPLPVELLSLTARALNHHTAKIEWSTASEQGASHFTIQRSSNGFDWVDVCNRNASGSSNIVRQYNCVDAELGSGIFYFRLIQFDLNGQSRSFGPVTVEIAPQKAEIKLYPNPAELDLFIEADFEIQNISIYSVDGKLVQSLNGNQSPFQRISLEQLRSGMYLIGISDSFGNTTFERLIRE
ncbi:MAG: T9SS type A sorting domain-containing protein [Flavobacteriales bacterium]